MRRDAGLLALAALPAALLYFSTLCPTAYGDFDSAEFASVIPRGGIPHPPGYPLYVAWARLISALVPGERGTGAVPPSTTDAARPQGEPARPAAAAGERGTGAVPPSITDAARPQGEPAYGVNAASALAAAVGVALACWVGWRQTGSAAASLAGAWTLAASFTYWSMATVAEVYVVQAAIELLAIAALAMGSSRLLAFVLGLGLANHPSTVLIAVPMLAGAALDPSMRAEARAAWPRLLGLLCLPGVLYAYLPLASRLSSDPGLWVRELGLDLTRPADLWWYLSLKAYPGSLYRYELQYLTQEAGTVLGWLLNDFTLPGVALGLLGLATLQRPVAVALLLAIAAQVAFYLGFTATDKFTMFCPAFALFGACIGPGGAFLLSCSGRWKPFAAALLFAIPAWLCGVHYPAADRSAYSASAEYARAALAGVEGNAVIVAGWQQATVLDYFAPPGMTIRHYTPALIVTAWRMGLPSGDLRTRWRLAEELLRSTEPVYAAFGTPELAAHFDREPAGALYRLRPRKPPAVHASAPAGWPVTAVASWNGAELLELAAEPLRVRPGSIARLRYRWRVKAGAGAIVRTSLHSAENGRPVLLGHERQLEQPHPLSGPGWVEETLDFTFSEAGTGTAIPPGRYLLAVRVGEARPAACARLEVLAAER